MLVGPNPRHKESIHIGISNIIALPGIHSDIFVCNDEKGAMGYLILYYHIGHEQSPKAENHDGHPDNPRKLTFSDTGEDSQACHRQADDDCNCILPNRMIDFDLVHGSIVF